MSHQNLVAGMVATVPQWCPNGPRVGLLAQGLASGSGVQASWPCELLALSRTQLLALQTARNERGFRSGTPDGVMGPATREGIRRYQRSLGLPADGYPTIDLLERLLQP